MSKSGDFSGIVKGTINYLKCSFDFTGTDWNQCKIAVVFEKRGNEYATALGSDRTVTVPADMSEEKSFRVYVVGAKDNYKIVTNKVLVKQEG